MRMLVVRVASPMLTLVLSAPSCCSSFACSSSDGGVALRVLESVLDLMEDDEAGVNSNYAGASIPGTFNTIDLIIRTIAALVPTGELHS